MENETKFQRIDRQMKEHNAKLARRLKIADLEYIDDGLFTRFIPNTRAGESAWRTMASMDGVAAILNRHADVVIANLRAAGYTVAKANKSEESIDDILAELEI